MADNTLQALSQYNTLQNGGTMGDVLLNTRNFTEDQIAEFHTKAVIPNLDDKYKMQIGLGQGGNPSVIGVGNVVNRLAQNAELLNAYFEAYNMASTFLFNDYDMDNPLKDFKRAYSPLGGYVVELANDIATEHKFSAGDEGSPFARGNYDIAEAIHNRRWSAYFEVTLQDTFSKQILQSWQQFDAWLYMQLQRMYNAKQVSEYENMKRQLTMAVYDGTARVYPLDQPDPSELMQAIKMFASIITDPSRAFNKEGLATQVKKENLRLILSAEVGSNIDVNFLANVFNMGVATTDVFVKRINYFPSLSFYTADHTVVAEDFTVIGRAEPWLDPRQFKIGDVIPAGNVAKTGAPGATVVYDGKSIFGALVDKNFFVDVDQLDEKVSSIVDPLHRRTNVFLHVEEIMSVSPFTANIFFVQQSAAVQRGGLLQRVGGIDEPVYEFVAPYKLVTYTGESGDSVDSIVIPKEKVELSKPTEDNTIAEIKAYLDSKNVYYQKNASKDELLALV